MKYSLITIIIVLAINNYSNAQLSQQWVQRYNGPGNSFDKANSMAVDNSGNVYVTGYSTGYGTNYDFTTIKYNSSGIQQWIQRYNGSGNGYDEATAIGIDAYGNVYVTGYSTVNEGNTDYATIKYNSSGSLQWIMRFNGPVNSYDLPSSLAVDASGNVYVTGYISVSGANNNYATIKYNTLGIEQWVMMYDGGANSFDEATSIAIDSSGNIYVTGMSQGNISNYDYATIKYNSSGIQQWVARYDGPAKDFDVSISIAVDVLSNVYVSGVSYSMGIDVDIATIKYDSSGNQLWIQRYNGPDKIYDEVKAIALDGLGNVYVAGYISSFATNRDYVTIKYNSKGTQQWVQTYDRSGYGADQAEAIAVDASGNVYVTGTSRDTLSWSDYTTIKYSSSGAQQWVMRYDGPGKDEDEASSIGIDVSGNIYVAGFSRGTATYLDYATIKYSQSTGIQSFSNEAPEKFSLSQNYPNPFNPKTIINYQLLMQNFVSLKVYNLLGAEISTLVNEIQNGGTYSVEWDARNFSSGVYFYKLEAGGFVEVKKMTLVK